VTTGDDSSAADRLAADLKTLRNNCRYYRTGLLPQAEARRAELEGKLTELESLEYQSEKLRQQLEEIRIQLAQLQNHKQALAYAGMEADAARVEQARTVMEQARAEATRLEELCATLDSQEDLRKKVQELHNFRQQWNDIQMEQDRVLQET
jgi:predicted nuclease with TOPRIM domain